MTHTSFFYWLQGYFELCRSNRTSEPCLSLEHVACIMQHAALVSASNFPSPAPGARHPDDARFALVCTLLTLMYEGVAGLELGTAKLRTLIHEQFAHVIDPQAGPAETQALLNNLHHAGVGGKPLQRC